MWSFGDIATSIITHLLFLREKLKPYLGVFNQAAHEHGMSPMYLIYFEFRADPAGADRAEGLERARMLRRPKSARHRPFGVYLSILA